MSRARLWTVCRLELLHYLKRPLFWIWILIVALCVFGLSSGSLRIQAGDSSTGGLKAHITSAFTNAYELTILGTLFYIFFVAVAAGMELIRDREQRVESLVHSTPLTPGEYVWGKYLSALLASLAVLGFHVSLSMLLKQVVTPEFDPDLVGPWSLLNYLQPALLFGLPLILFVSGVAFAIGERTRRAVLVNLFPLATLLVSVFVLWGYHPVGLDPRIDRALSLIDPTGFRWLKQTWLEVDRGATFYNESLIGFDLAFYLSRLAFALVGLGSVALSRKHLSRELRGKRVSPRKVDAAMTRTEAPAAAPFVRPQPLAELRMTNRRPGFLTAVRRTTHSELRAFLAHPGVWLFLPLIVLNAIFDAIESRGAFDSPLLVTPGRSAVGSLNELTFSLLLFLMVFTVEGLRRDEKVRLARITYATPISTRALLLGKLLASSLLAVVPMVAVYGVCVAVQLHQEKVPLDPWPYVLVYGGLLFPVVLIWNGFIALLFSLTGNRFATYALGFGALIGTGLQLVFGTMSWVWNWSLAGAVRWTDMGPFELDRVPLALNRVLVLVVAALFFALTVRTFPRRTFDTTRILTRLRPRALLRQAWTLSPLLIAAFVLAITLQRGVNAGPGGERAEEAAKDYWRKNLRTWLDAQNPEIADVELALELRPSERWLHSRGTYTLRNPHDEPLERIALTGGTAWEEVSWTLEGEAFEPRDDSGLFVFELDVPLASGAECRIGFDFENTRPPGMSKNGSRGMEFLTDSSVVLTSFSPNMAPIVGYVEDIGVTEENEYDAREYPEDFHTGVTRPAFGSSTPHSISLTVTAPEDYRVNGVGTLRSDTVQDGLRTMVWESDHPVRFFNVVAGRWDVRRGEGTAVYHHPSHTYNLDEMLLALDGAREHYSRWFHPFPWEELRLSEFPSYAGYAQGFPTNITFSESIGFLTRDDGNMDLAFRVTAHEAAHQWWGNLLTPGEGPGGNLLSEGTSEFSTMLLTEEIKGLAARIELCTHLEAFYTEGRVVDSERPLVKVDGSRDGDGVLTYEKMGWACWMLHQHLGAQRSLEAHRSFFAKFAPSPDHPVIQDYLLHLRDFAPDPEAFDAFVEQWFFETVLPEYVIGEPRVEGGTVRFSLTNTGTGTMPVEVAVERGVRFPADPEEEGDAGEEATADPEPFREARRRVTLEAGASVEVEIPCDFEPERLVVDPDALVLQRGRERALHRF